MAPTLTKSPASVSWTSVNWAVGPAIYPDAYGPNAAAPSWTAARVTFISSNELLL